MTHSILPDFVGRDRELAALGAELEAIRQTGRGRFVTVRGRRRVGKSWLVEEFIGRHRLPSVYFTATKGGPDGSLRRFTDALAGSSLPAAAAASGQVRFLDWEAALITAGADADRANPSVIVLDEFPYLGEDDPLRTLTIESLVSAAWERHLARRPVLLVIIGSDVAMMERLTSHGRPLYDRPTRQLVVDAMDPREVATITGLSAADAFDAYLVVGGLPGLARGWRPSVGVRGFLMGALAEPDTPYVHAGSRMIDADFPADIQARVVLAAIGHGERTASTIAARTGIPGSNLDRSLKALVTKRVVRVDQPLGAAPLRAPRYSVADPYLRFWLHFVLPSSPEIERIRTTRVVDRIMAGWEAYRGRAIEPVVRSAIERLLPHDQVPGANHVGSWWTRTNDIQVDLVGADGPVAPANVAFVGSIKWRSRQAFDRDDERALMAAVRRVPGVSAATPLVAVSRAGVQRQVTSITMTLGPDDLLEAYATG